LSLTVAVNCDVPLADGVPEITPVVAASVRPAGKLPDEIDHVYAGVPPLACNAVEYSVPSFPEGSVAVVTFSGDDALPGATVMEAPSDAVCTGLPESVTVTVNLKLFVPLPVELVSVGVPEMMPVDASIERPLGSWPEVMLQV
jgi:hypothetical protein